MSAFGPDARLHAGTAPQSTAVSVRALTKRFTPRASVRDMIRLARRPAPVTVVSDVTLDVGHGEIFGLLGPNGAGKTTIFKMLATMIAPDAGTATVGGFDVTDEAAAVRRVLACVPADERSLNWRLTAQQNLELFAALQQLSRGETDARIAAVLATVGLSDSLQKRVAEFSSGMRQRLLIARALLMNPRILLLDEPTRTLDPLSARELRRFLREELAARHGCTILLATHNTDEAFGFCDRVAVLHRGRLLAVGAAGELASRYGDERYRVLVRHMSNDILVVLERCAVLQRVRVVERNPDGWTTIECTIPGDAAGSAEVLRTLVERGVAVSRLERVETSLADLITRIIGADSGDDVHA